MTQDDTRFNELAGEAFDNIPYRCSLIVSNSRARRPAGR